MATGHRTLLLMRHAKSDYPDGVSDHERPLAPRGEREAGLAGVWIRATASPVDAILCSSATRTRQTLERTGIEAPTLFVDRLYDSTPGTVLGEVNSVAGRFAADGAFDGDSGAIATLLVVGHEPVMSSLALALADVETGEGEAAERISRKFPTSAIAVLRFTGTWDQLALGGAELAAFHVPR
jgi:phosphohistidine phosphatase